MYTVREKLLHSKLKSDAPSRSVTMIDTYEIYIDNYDRYL